MMQLTNKHNLPAALVRAIEADTYDRGDSDITVTQLIQPPQMRMLNKTRPPIEDASDRIFSLMGQSMHTVLERAAVSLDDGSLAERRMFANIRGWKVSGQFDLYETGVLSDWKMTTVYAADGKTEWTQQLNMLRVLMEDNHYPVSQLQIVAIFRDWMKKKAEVDKDYPQSQVKVIPVMLWPIEVAREFIKNRVLVHQAAENGASLQCTDEERWYSGNVYALMKKGGKRAVKLFDTKEAAEKACETQGKVDPKGSYHVVYRPGEYKRCMNYCSAADVCQQWEQDLQRMKESEDATAGTATADE